MIIIFCLILIAGFNIFSQTWLPTYRDENGYSIPYNFPPPDSSYLHNEIIIFFKPQALFLNKLCYEIQSSSSTKSKDKDITLSITNNQLLEIFSQRFPVDSLIADPNLLLAIKSFGGDSLKRITFASPCHDTISIGKNGDTLKCYDYLWMVLHLNNDTNAINASIWLTILHQDKIVGASLNFLYKPFREPSLSRDPYYTSQKSLHGQSDNFPLSGFNRAWDFQTGNYQIRVSILDDGIDYRNCDLGANYGTGYKVVDGWNFSEPQMGFAFNSLHGTQVAGVVGAYTNRSGNDNGCAVSPNGISGIAGGWGYTPDLGIGCQLIGFNVHVNRALGISTAYASSAIRASSAYYPRFGNTEIGIRFVSDIINCSWGSTDFNDPGLRDAVNYAYQHGVSFIAASGNQDTIALSYPASFDNAWVTDVGAGNKHRARVHYSNYSNKLDFIAPGGSCSNTDPIPNDDIVYSTNFTNNGQNINSFGCFDGTSAAAPHATGLIALLRSEALEKGWSNLEPEDYEGIIKASCLDINENYNQFGGDIPNNPDNYSNGFDIKSGWGHLQADRLFEMLAQGYRISHFNITSNFNTSQLSPTPTSYSFIDNGNPLNKNWILTSGNYKAIPYLLANTLNLPSGKWQIDNDHPLFVWGRSGRSNRSGLSLAGDPIYQSGYTRVISGTGGNGLVDGIIHSQSLNVNVNTYQFHVWSNDFSVDFGLIPPNNEMGANISVFGMELPTSVKSYDIFNENFYASVFPNPIANKLTVQLITKVSQNICLSLFSVLGEKLKSLNFYNNIQDNFSYDIDFNDLPSGIYFLNILVDGSSKTVKLIYEGK